MPKLANPLTDLKIRHAKPGNKLLKLSDGAGMYLEILPTQMETSSGGFDFARRMERKT